MDLELAKQFIKQALAMAVQYVYTGRTNKAIEVIAQVKKIEPDNDTARAIMDWIVAPQMGLWPPKIDWFIGDWWQGQTLEGKSIEIFCDQGMGDTINLLRYLKLMKDRWGCRTVLNYYAYHRDFKRLMERVPYVDTFTGFHEKCDYFTNIMSVPALLNDLRYKDYYPAHFQDLLDTTIPPPEPFGEFESRLRPEGFKVGLAWHSNLDNPIGQKKSIPFERFAVLEDGKNDIFSLLPDGERVNFCVQLPIEDLEDTAGIIAGCDVVVSVDTAALHLAGSMGKKTLGLLPHEADARWGLGPTTVWYPTVELYRQPEDLNWEPVISQVKERLVSLRSIG